MGNCQCGQQHQVLREVNQMPNIPDPQIKLDGLYGKNKSDGWRFGEPLFTRRRQNNFNFLMTVRNEQGLEQISLNLTILRQLVQCILYDEYELDIDNTTIIDIFQLNNYKNLPIFYSVQEMQNFEQVLISVSNRKNKTKYSMKIYGFKTYKDDIFKRGLYEIYLHNLIGPNNKSIMNLLHYFVVDRSPLQKALIFLYQPVQTSLSNMIEYRSLANQHWTDLQIMGIIRSVLTGYSSLQKLKIFHRDLRPTRIYFSQPKNQYIIGNLSDARIIKNNMNQDVISVKGFAHFNSEAVQKIVEKGNLSGQYDPQMNDYHFILKLFQYLSYLTYIPPKFHAQKQIFKKVIKQLQAGVMVEQILKSLTLYEMKVRDYNHISNLIILVNATHSKFNDLVLLNAYFNLHYNQQFSKLAHTYIQHNIQIQKPQQNAHIFLRLGDYYSQAGNSAQDYYINAFILFLKRGQNRRKMGFYNQAFDQLIHAKRCYKHIEDIDYKAQYSKQLALVKCKIGELKQAKITIDQIIEEAADKDKQISMQLQLDLLLAKGLIYFSLGQIQQAEKYIKFGMNLCQSKQNFDHDQQKQRRYKSDFLMSLGRIQLKQAQLTIMLKYNKSKINQHDPSALDEKIKKYLAKSQKLLLASLQLKQDVSTEHISTAELTDLLGALYYDRRSIQGSQSIIGTQGLQDIHRAKKQYELAIQFKNFYGNALNPLLKVSTYYELGNCQKILGQLVQAQESYTKAIQILEMKQNISKDPHLLLVIKGNRALVKIQQGKIRQGNRQANEVKQELKQLVGSNSGDYVFLQTKLVEVNAKMQKSHLLKTKKI